MKKKITDERAALRSVPRATSCNLPTEPPEEDTKGLICWWCVHDLPQRPCIHLPIRYDDKLDRFGTIGNFCSWACAKAYALDMGTARSGEIGSFLALMRRKAFGKTVPLWAAPKREALTCFGGTMTIEEFRSFGGAVEPPQVYYPFEKRFVPTVGNDNTNLRSATTVPSTVGGAGRLKAIENSSSETDTLRLRRNKPLVRATSKLENALGIKRKGKEPAP
jgi:MYM-type Zinc finger with FCS sequence motif